VSQQNKDIREKIKDLEPQLEALKQSIITTTIDGGPGESGRRKELARYVRRSLTSTAPINGFHSVLEEIEKRSQGLLEEGAAAQFVNKSGVSDKVVELVERFQEAITHYQVSSHRVFV